MPEYLSPGVYVEEIDAGPKPIEGVSTSTAGTVGVTSKGPSTGKPELVTSFAEFTRKFGGFLAEPVPALFNQWALNATEGGRWWQFALSVKGFFDNGGQRIYVKRVFSSGADASLGDSGVGVVAELTSDATSGATTLRLRHLLGIQANSAVNLFQGAQAVAGNPFTVLRYSAGTNEVTLSAAIPADMTAGRDFVEVIARAVPAPATLRFEAASVGLWGDALAVRVRPMVGAALRILHDPLAGRPGFATTAAAAAAVGDATVDVLDTTGFAVGDVVSIGAASHTITAIAAPTLTITPLLTAAVALADPVARAARANDPFESTVSVAVAVGAASVTVVSAAGFATGDLVDIGGRFHTVTAVAAQTLTIAPATPVALAIGGSVRRLRSSNVVAAGNRTLLLQGAGQLYEGALVELDAGTTKERLVVDEVIGNQVRFTSDVTLAYHETRRLRTIEAEVSVRYEPDGFLESEEIFPNLRLVDDGGPSYLVTHLNTRSALIRVTGLAGLSATDFADFPSVPPPPGNHDDRALWMGLTGGDDDYTGLTVDDFVGVDGGSGARTGIQGLEDIDEISICLAPGIWSTTVHGALIQHCEILKDRFAVLDPRDGLSIEGIREFREPLDSKYAALYYPWLEVRDPSVGRNVICPPSAHMAGIYARVDVERGVHKAPANEVIRGIFRIAQDVTKREQDMLNPRGINALRFFPGRGNRVWGARTVTSDASWKYINVRRLFIFVEESIEEGTQWVVFEPNDEPLWARVRQTISNFLFTVWRNGALQGATPAEAFFVKCDRSTMTQDDIDNGRLICLIGIAPVKPAEFVIFRIQQKTIETQQS